ncbi:hypothetical protein Nepgr_031905 [Nepenthes gracilis]|uniref:Uncharacterized protein n=1 Tax=Nepenthes gracilis TaxID=150966 RepID=A0AAD3TJN9_NEPGR|nr:hypothetical protein Nepgr_031905 [Nepenthes gracilis]
MPLGITVGNKFNPGFVDYAQIFSPSIQLKLCSILEKGEKEAAGKGLKKSFSCIHENGRRQSKGGKEEKEEN